MSVDVSKNVFELFSGKKRTRLVPTLIIAVSVTALVAVPLIWRAVDARNNPVEPDVVLAPADSQLVLVDTVDGDPLPLDAATVQGPILISVRDEAASSVAFNLYAAGADQAVIESVDIDGPQFDMVVSATGGGEPFDSTLLRNGTYELFVTIRTPDEDRRTAVGFEVANP